MTTTLRAAARELQVAPRPDQPDLERSSSHRIVLVICSHCSIAAQQSAPSLAHGWWALSMCEVQCQPMLRDYCVLFRRLSRCLALGLVVWAVVCWHDPHHTSA